MLQNMIPPRLKSVLAKRPQGSSGAWRKRILIVAGFVLVFSILVHLGVRFIIWPQIETSKSSVERLLSARIGAEVSMDKLNVSWVGIRPEFEIEGLRFNGPDKNKSLLSIQKINGELSWSSFYHLAPYFHELYFEGAQIYSQRNSKGVITVAGISIHGNSDDHSGENWLFSQNNIQLRDLQLFWDDQLNKKAMTSIEVQNLSLTNGIRKHKGSLSATTPWTTGPIAINVDFAHRIGGQPGDWRDWIGSISWNLSNLNLNQIAKEFAVPLSTLEGVLSSNGKLRIDNGKPDGGDVYIAADNLTLQLSKGEDAIALGRLETNLSQETVDGLIAVTTKSFAWRDIESPQTAPLENLSPMTFRWRPPAADGEIKEFGFSSPKISMEDIALFAVNLPLSKKVQKWIKASQADGELQDLDIKWSESKSALSTLNIPGGWFKSNKLDFTVSGKLVDVSFIGINKSMPTVSRLSGFLTADHNQGNFSVNSENLDLEINDFLVDPKIHLDKAFGQISWSKSKGGWAINTKELALSNREINTTLKVNYLIGGPKQPDNMVLDMSFPTANVATAYRYLPVGMSKDAIAYLSKAFAGGVIEKGSLHIKGNPDDIPFPKNGSGEFALNLPIKNATFSPAPSPNTTQGIWPALTNVNALIAMKNANFTVNVPQANYKQVVLSEFRGEIPSVSANQLVLNVSGAAKGGAPEMLEYFLASPVGKKLPKLDQNLTVTGPATLNLDLKIPLSGPSDPVVDVNLDFPGNRVQWSKLPPFENLKGKLRFSETHPEFENITANFMGGDLKISSASQAPGNKNFNIQGNVAAKFLKDYFAQDVTLETQPILSAMSGSAKYEGLLSFNKGSTEINLKLDLRDWANSAPLPIKKVAGTALAGQLTLKTTPNKSGASVFTWNGKIGDQYFIQGEINGEDATRNAIGVGAPATVPQQGLLLNLTSNEIDLDVWRDFLETQTKKSSTSKTGAVNNDPLQINAQLKKVILFNRVWQDLNISANNKGEIWEARFRGSPQVAGNIQYQSANSSDPSGFVSGRLTRLKVPDEIPIQEEAVKTGQKSADPKNRIRPDTLPSLDLTIDDFSWSKAQLGQLKLKTKTSDNLVKLESWQVINPQGTTNISGQWIGATQNNSEHTDLNIKIDVKNAGQIIAHWSNQKSIEGGQGQVGANVEWDGSPFKPKFETLSGKANLNLTKGRLLEVDTNGAKLLDVLSLQSLFRFATFDLKGSIGSVATKGTPFNSIDSDFDISSGIAQTKQFNMVLDQARVAMSGQINIPKQTQDLRVAIFPTIDATAGSLAAFAINPIVGLGALVGQFLITNQINRNYQSDYLVQGSWEDPDVIPLDQKGQPIDPKTLDRIRSKELLREQARPDYTSPTNSGMPLKPNSPVNSPN